MSIRILKIELFLAGEIKGENLQKFKQKLNKPPSKNFSYSMLYFHGGESNPSGVGC